MATVANITRRHALKLFPAGIAAAGVPAAALAAQETPGQKVNRLAEELAHALDDYYQGSMHAVVWPASSGYGHKTVVTDIRPSNPEDAVKFLLEKTKYQLQLTTGGPWVSKFSQADGVIVMMSDNGSVEFPGFS